METWTVKQVADHIGIGVSTLQQRTDQYSWALSEGAAPGKGQTRRFTPRDVAIHTEIERQYKSSITHEQIALTLREAIERGEFDDVTDFPSPPEGTMSLAEVGRITGRLEQALIVEKERREKAEAELLKAREEIAYLKGQIKEMRDHGNQDEVIRLNRELAKAELLLEMERAKHQ